MKTKIFLIVFTIAFWSIAPHYVKSAPPNFYVIEFEKFCKTYLVWVEQYPIQLSAGCCNIKHYSNKKLIEGYKGESLLICNGRIIDGSYF